MKAYITLELYNEDVRETFHLYRTIFSTCGGDLGAAVFDNLVGRSPPRSSWVAEITGPDEKYILARTFLRSNVDYKRSNGKGSRGVLAEFILASGRIYEVHAQVSQRRSEHYFCSVNDEGDIFEIPEEEVFHGFGLLTKSEREYRTRLKIAEIMGSDDQYLLARRFLDCDLSYSPGFDQEPLSDYPGYALEPGRIYEAREKKARGRQECYFFTVDDRGRTIKISDETAYHAVGALTRKERLEKKYAERISGDQRPGGGAPEDCKSI